MKCDRTFHDAITKLTKDGYSRKIEHTLLSFHTSDVGFRLGGSTAENKASEFLFNEFKDIGLTCVHLEEVPTAACEFTGACVLVNGSSEGDGTNNAICKRKLIGSQITGYPCTGPEGIKAPLIYVGTGRSDEYEAISIEPDFFNGKLVLIDSTFDTLWVCWQAAEAKARGVAGIVLTAMEEIPEGGYFSYAPDMLAGQDGMSRLDFPPLVYISQQDGNWLKQYLEDASVVEEKGIHPTSEEIELAAMSNQMSAVAHRVGDDGNIVTMISNGKITRPEDGGMGYNVLGQIRGTGEPDKMVIISAHQDAHLMAGADDTGAVAAVTMLAKAMIMSGYEPYYTVQFLLTSSEEYGACDTVYDWQHGMYTALKTHSDWPGRVVGVLNNEVMAEKGGHLEIIASCDVAPFVDSAFSKIKEERPELVPNGTELIPVLITIGDEWSTSAAGIPSMDITCKRYDYLSRYHTNYDCEDNLDYELLGKTAEFVGLMAKSLDEEVLPWDIAARAADLQAIYTNPEASGPAMGMPHRMTKDAAIQAGVDPTVADNLEKAIEEYVAAANRFQEMLQNAPNEDIRALNDKIMQIEKKALTSFVALSVFQSTVYPYQQTLSDVIGLTETLVALEKEKPNREEIIEAMGHVNEIDFGYFSFTRNAGILSRSAYDDMVELCREHEGDWSSFGKLTPVIDLYDQYRYVMDENNTDYREVLEYVRKQYDGALENLEGRLRQMTDDVRELTGMIQDD